ncbi:MAG: D-alanine--D-alanine ligase [Deltaproteobacteria bacterium]|nr:D-alanine--D-alanine ligase [Deltaproteobacteria bacterium]MCW5804714.1 D-alanine--D-alanine ligase [Deltaproteobacteria bacterium]
MQSRKIGVLLGGLSSEREVSLRTGEAVLAALRDRGHDAIPIYVDRDVDVALRQERIEVAFVALHGRWGEDGSIQGLLEMLGIPYTGSDVLASALAMHKGKAKELFRLHNLPTPAYYSLTAEQMPDLADVHGDFGFPCVVKPIREGSSVGVTIVERESQLAPAIERALCFDDEILVERFITGREISVAVLDGRALGAVEIAPRDGFYDYANKYTRGATDYFVPPRLSPERYRGVLAHAQRAHLALGCSGATRVDMIVSDSGNEFILEVNTVPGLTPTSLLPKIADAAGISFGELCEAMLAGASLATSRGRGERRVVQRAYVGEDRREAFLPHH